MPVQKTARLGLPLQVFSNGRRLVGSRNCGPTGRSWPFIACRLMRKQ